MKQHCFLVMKSFTDLAYFHESLNFLLLDYERIIEFCLKHVGVIIEETGTLLKC